MWVIDQVFEMIGRTRLELASLQPQAKRGVAHRTWYFAETHCERGEMPAARAGLRNVVRIWAGMLRQPRVWGLWAARYTGYGAFVRASNGKQLVERKLRRATSVSP
jgi:hypothetical protein